MGTILRKLSKKQVGARPGSSHQGKENQKKGMTSTVENAISRMRNKVERLQSCKGSVYREDSQKRKTEQRKRETRERGWHIGLKGASLRLGEKKGLRIPIYLMGSARVRARQGKKGETDERSKIKA